MVAKTVSYDELKDRLKKYIDRKGIKEIDAAYEYAKEKHKGQYRKTGEPYIIHPIAVAHILTSIKADKDTIIAALLHDVVEDTETSKKEIEEKFGETVAKLVDGVTKINNINVSTDNEYLTSYYKKNNGETVSTIDNIQINNEIQYWEKGKGVYKIGGKNDLFNLSEIKREQIQDGITFNIGFTNLNTFLKTTIVLYAIKLIIYYEVIEDSYDIDVKFDSKEIVLSNEDKQQISMKINLENKGSIPIVNKNVYIATPNEIDITNNKFPQFDLDIGEKFTIGNLQEDQIIITPKK